MTDFSLTTTWLIPAPIGPVWSCLTDTETWPKWWPYVESVTELESGSPQGILNKRNYRWRTCLPYHLRLEMTVMQIVPNSSITVTVTGDLAGTGHCQLSVEPDSTRVDFHWQVRTCKTWMNHFSALTRPIFEWNHARVMKQGERGLIDHLSALKNKAIT
ncbi:MAG: SRPBCC family protein [Gammaproteobacteria bacterium]